MRNYSIIILMVSFLGTAINAQEQNSFYDFSVKNIYGEDFNLSSLKGKKVLVVNTASKMWIYTTI